MRFVRRSECVVCQCHRPTVSFPGPRGPPPLSTLQSAIHSIVCHLYSASIPSALRKWANKHRHRVNHNILVLIRCHSLWVHWSRSSKVSRVLHFIKFGNNRLYYTIRYYTLIVLYVCVRLFYAINSTITSFTSVKSDEKQFSKPILYSTRFLRLFGEFANNNNFMEKYLFSRIPSYYWQKCQRIVCFISLCWSSRCAKKTLVSRIGFLDLEPIRAFGRSLLLNINNNTYRQIVWSSVLQFSLHAFL